MSAIVFGGQTGNLLKYAQEIRIIRETALVCNIGERVVHIHKLLRTDDAFIQDVFIYTFVDIFSESVRKRRLGNMEGAADGLNADVLRIVFVNVMEDFNDLTVRIFQLVRVRFMGNIIAYKLENTQNFGVDFELLF